MTTARSAVPLALFMAISLLLIGCQTQPATSSSQGLDGQEGIKDAPIATAAEPDQGDSACRATLALLDKRVTLERDEIAFKQVIEFLREQTGANIAVNWPALELIGTEPDSLATLKLKNVTARQLLQQTLEQVTAEIYDPEDGPAFAIRGGVVMVSTLRDFKLDTVLRQYSIDDLANARPTVNRRIYGRNNDARRMLGMTTLQNKAIDPETIEVKDLNPAFCANCIASRAHDRLEVALNVMTYVEQVDQIVELINTTVGDPDEWLDEESTLTEINGTILVKTTPENHAQIRHLFKSMRLERAQRFKRQALEMETFLLLEAAETARLKQDYKEALQKINQALRVDPNSLEARALKTIVTDTLSR